MNLIRFNQHPVFSSLFENFERTLSQNNENCRNDIPLVNVKDEEKQFVVELAAPGLEKEDFTIKLENNRLIVSSEKKEEKSEKNTNYTINEFAFNSFTRSFMLPKNIDINQVKADYKSGIIVINLPKKEVEEKMIREIKIS